MIISKPFVMPVLLGLYVFLASDYGELPDAPAPLTWRSLSCWRFGFMAFFGSGLIFQQELMGIIWWPCFCDSIVLGLYC